MKKLFVTILLAAMGLTVFAQQNSDPVIFEVAGQKIHKSEFMKEFLQSIGKDPSAAPTACTYEKRKSLQDYANLFVNFRAKLADAYAQKIDTLHNLNSELATYRKELAAPYLIDSLTLQNLLHEAYDRNHYALHAAHILVKCDQTSADSTKAYARAKELYKRIIAGEDFYALAQEEMKRQHDSDPNPEVREKPYMPNPTEGDLGCFTVFDMIYAFESAAYSMVPGEVHAPVRTRWGYHIIKLIDKFPYYGKATVAHIWVRDEQGSDAGRSRINNAYQRLQSGEDFASVAKHLSNDRNTAANGGVLPELACNQLPPEYIQKIAEGLKVGEYTKPFQSRFGFHIIKLITQESMPEFESLIPYYRQRMTRGERSVRPQSIFIEQCKQKYPFIDYTTSYGKLTKGSDNVWVYTPDKKVTKKSTYAADLVNLNALVPDSIFSAIWHYDSNKVTDLRPLFNIGGKNYTSRDLGWYIYKHRKVSKIYDKMNYVKDKYKEFVDAKILDYADSRLELDNPEFADLIDEYRHGLMIFSYNDRMVWSKALHDTIGFTQFYESTSPQKDYNDSTDAIYFWNERARVLSISITDSNCIDPSKAQKIIEKAVKKGWNSDAIRDALAHKINRKACTEENPISISIELPESGNQKLLSSNEWKKGIYSRKSDKGYQILIVENLMAPELKSLQEARGYYLNDYQNFLEEQLVKELRQKYNVIIHQDVIDEITY